MQHLTLKWLGKVLLYAGIIIILAAINIVWRPSRWHKTVNSQPLVIPAAVQDYLNACRQKQNDIVEVHHCEHGWAVFKASRSPQIFSDQGEVLCAAKDITDASASDCLRKFSDQVGRCVVECSSVNSSNQTNK